MDKKNAHDFFSSTLEKKLLPEGGTVYLEKLEPNQSCSVTLPLYAVKPGTYTIRADFTYNEGKINPIATTTTVISTLEAELNIDVFLSTYVVTRLSLNFTLGSSNN